MAVQSQIAGSDDKQYDLQAIVEIDEFMVGGFEQQAPGRTGDERLLAVLTVKKMIDKKGNENLDRGMQGLLMVHQQKS